MFSRPRRRTQLISGAAMVVLLGLAVGSSAVAVNAFGVGDKFDHLLAASTGTSPGRRRTARRPDGPGDRAPEDEERIRGARADGGPDAGALRLGDPGADTHADPRADADADPAAGPRKPRRRRHRRRTTRRVFAHEIKDTWCASAGVQMVLAILGHGRHLDALPARAPGPGPRVGELQGQPQRRLGAVGDGRWPSTTTASPGYEVRAYKTRQGALRDAAKAIEKTGSPVILLAWRGAHTWVMTGFRADADPAVFANAKVTGAYILDPWYPDVSSIWGPSDPPGTFQNAAEMDRNYLPVEAAGGPVSRSVTACTSRSCRPTPLKPQRG